MYIDFVLGVNIFIIEEIKYVDFIVKNYLVCKINLWFDVVICGCIFCNEFSIEFNLYYNINLI